jgi:SAM-dependent methyltransferase
VQRRPLIARLLFRARDFMYRDMFAVLCRYCRGQVLDVGGANFVQTARSNNISFDTWTILEPDVSSYTELIDAQVKVIQGDGCNSPFPDGAFDTVLCIQVAEHVFAPFQLLEESKRVLKHGGYSIWIVPWTGNLHGSPYHYQNVSHFWYIEAARRADMEIIELKALGGAWSTIASRLVYYLLQMTRWGSMSYPDAHRNVLFYMLFPFMVVFVLISVPICLLFSLGDMEEEANNYLCVFRKK